MLLMLKKDQVVLSLNYPGHRLIIVLLKYCIMQGLFLFHLILKREVEESDAERYQTIYAQSDGSVAAPTAGLHFTENIFEKLRTKNIETDFVTLHVGAGTFKPVKTETMQEHEMHAEFIDVSKETIENILQNLSNNIIAVGTTSLRTIESLYWLGLKLAMSQSGNGNVKINQFIAFSMGSL